VLGRKERKDVKNCTEQEGRGLMLVGGRFK
jgi:hypothetical protein